MGSSMGTALRSVYATRGRFCIAACSVAMWKPLCSQPAAHFNVHPNAASPVHGPVTTLPVDVAGALTHVLWPAAATGPSGPPPTTSVPAAASKTTRRLSHAATVILAPGPPPWCSESLFMQLPWANPVRTECTDPFSVCHLLPPSQAPSTTAGWSPTADTVRHAAPLLLCTMNTPAAGGVGGTGDGGGGGGDGDGDGDGDGFVELHCDSDCAC